LSQIYQLQCKRATKDHPLWPDCFPPWSHLIYYKEDQSNAIWSWYSSVLKHFHLNPWNFAASKPVRSLASNHDAIPINTDFEFKFDKCCQLGADNKACIPYLQELCDEQW